MTNLLLIIVIILQVVLLGLFVVYMKKVDKSSKGRLVRGDGQTTGPGDEG